MSVDLARVVSDHVPLNDGSYAWPKGCRACGLPWPCHTFQRQLQGQSGNHADRMRAHMTVWTLRMLSRPELAFIGPDVSTQLLGWIDSAVAAQDAVDRARKAIRTRAQTAASRFAGHAWAAASRFTPLVGERRPTDQTPRADTDDGQAHLAVTPPDNGQPGGAPDERPGVRARLLTGHRRFGRGRTNR
jgi:hypothetical protein